MTGESHPLDKFVRGATAQVAALVWGFAEATVFFIVPDVLLTAIGCRSVRGGLKATAFAVSGAIVGGIVVYCAGKNSPEHSQAWLACVPAIHPQLIARSGGAAHRSGRGDSLQNLRR